MAKRKNTNALFSNADKNEQQKTNVEQNKTIEEICKSDDSDLNNGSESKIETQYKDPYLATTQDIQLEELKSKISNLIAERDRLCNEIQTLKNTLEEKDAQMKNYAALTLHNQALKDENDEYLMKISELTFENAKMNCQLQELSKSTSNKVPQHNNAFSSQNMNVNNSKNVPYIRRRMVDIHGYESWN